MKRYTNAIIFLLAAVLSIGGATQNPARAQAKPSPAQANNANSAQTEFFETQVRPLLVKQCIGCHGATQQAGGLRLDTRDGLLKGGGRGAAVVAGKPSESLLIQAVSYTHANLKMPPAGKLPDKQIAILTQWIQQGAVFPQSEKTKPLAAQTLWSLRSVRKPALPKVKNTAWIRNPIDAFVLAKLEGKGMTPAPPASKRDLMRRVYFDLIGLPPTPQEVSAYLADKSPNAYEKLVDRLLASPRYGERWARYWLDLVRYADSNGYERDAEKPYSWKYRDWVINALNSDKPYNRFITEQLAGDEMPDRSEETVTATGFLRLGTWDDEPNDPQQYKYERLDDLVHATSAAFLGLTVRCARCHNHKFDPISQKDYYRVAGAFWGGYLDPDDRKFNGGPPPEKLGYSVLGFTDKGREAPPLKLLKNGEATQPQEVVAPGYLSIVTQFQQTVQPAPADAQTTHRRLQLAQWLTDPRHPLTVRVFVNRIWQHHFGQGLVRTPNNYGTKGSPPTHPELLDWLAAAFMAEEKKGRREEGEKSSSSNGSPQTWGGRGAKVSSLIPHHSSFACGWRLKPLHRLILLSNTYRLASAHPKQAAYERRDFLNQWLWRANRQRLDADALRDSLLAVSGKLNLKTGGAGFVPTVTREALEGLSRKGAEWVPSSPDEQNRRTIYLFLKRALIFPLLTTFDFADTTQPLEQRDVTTVAPQALALMNNPFVQAQSEAFARQLEAEAGKDRNKQIVLAWRLALGRSPSASEQTAALAFLKEGERGRKGEGEKKLSPTENTANTETIENPKSKIQNSPLLPLSPSPPLLLWLRADAGVVADAGGRVSEWKDQSGQGHHATQNVMAAQPVLVRTADGKAALRFDGKGAFMALAGQVLTSQQFSIFAVVNDRSGSVGHREIFSNWNSNGNIGTSLFFGLTGAGNVRLSDAFAPAGTVSQPQNTFLLTGIAGESDVSIFQNRMEIARLAASLPPRNLSAPYVIGQQGNINGEFWNGDILELRVYNRALNAAECEAVWDAIHAKDGIAPRVEPADGALTSLCHLLFNMNEFVYVD